MNRETAERLHTMIVATRELADDKTASIAPEIYGNMQYDGALIKAGTRINWNGVLKKAAVDLWDTKENNPDNAPTLWDDLPYKDGYRIIPEVITVTTAFDKDELGWWGDVLYRSKVNSNVYTPAVYPDNWEVVSAESI